MFMPPLAGSLPVKMPSRIIADTERHPSTDDNAYCVASRTSLSPRDGTTFVEILDGCVALCRSLPGERRQILDILGQGRILFPGNTDGCTCAAITMTHTRLRPMSSDKAADRVCGEVNLMLQRSLDHSLLLGRKTAAERVATALLDLSEQFSEAGKNCGHTVSFRLVLTRADLADWLGLTLETVSRCLNHFKREGLVSFSSSGHVTIMEPQYLSAIAAGDASA